MANIKYRLSILPFMYIDVGKNAMKFMGKEGTVTIAFEISPNNVVVGKVVYKTSEQGWDIKMKAVVNGTFDPVKNLLSLKSDEVKPKYAGETHAVYVEVEAKQINGVFVGEKDIHIDDAIFSAPFNAVE